MGGFFGAISRKNCKYDVFFGTDYHSHLGTKRGGLAFYDEEKGLYASYVREEGGKEGYHAYMQALVVLAKDLPKAKAERICRALKNPRGVMEDVGFGTLVWKYEAIIKTTGDVAWCVDDICERCGNMIFSGATSYWETPFGEADFDDAGSLCHAWTSVACYLFDKYLPQVN